MQNFFKLRTRVFLFLIDLHNGRLHKGSGHFTENHFNENHRLGRINHNASQLVGETYLSVKWFSVKWTRPNLAYYAWPLQISSKLNLSDWQPNTPKHNTNLMRVYVFFFMDTFFTASFIFFLQVYDFIMMKSWFHNFVICRHVSIFW